MADGVECNKKTGDGYSHPFAVDEPRSAFSVVSNGNFKPTTTRIDNNEALAPQRKIDGAHAAEKTDVVRNMSGQSQRFPDNTVDMLCDMDHDESFRQSNHKHGLKSHGDQRSEPSRDPSRTTDLTDNNFVPVAFLETPIIKPVRPVNVRGDAIGPGVVFDSRDSSECREIPHPNSIHENMNGNLRNRGGRRHEAPTFSHRNGSTRCANRDSGHEYSNVSNSNYPSAFSERHSNFVNNHRLANDLELLSRPSWCDAKFALDQIVQVSNCVYCITTTRFYGTSCITNYKGVSNRYSRQISVSNIPTVQKSFAYRYDRVVGGLMR